MPYEYDAETSQAIADLPQEQHDDAPQVEGQQNSDAGQQQVGGDPNWNPSEWQLKFRDQTIVPKDRAHLVNLAQQGFSYSQRMQELKQREEQLNGKSQQYDQYAKLEYEPAAGHTGSASSAAALAASCAAGSAAL